jgi:hypothetical protein
MTGVRAGVGHATGGDARAAGREAAETAVGRLEGAPTVAYAFGSSVYDQQALLAGINDRLDCSVVGGSTAGEIAHGETHTESVVVLALAGDGVRAGTGAAPPFDEHPRRSGMEAASEAAAALRESRDGESDAVSVSATVQEGDRWRWYPKTLVNAFGPGLTGSQEWAVIGVQDALGWAHVAGGFAGDDWKLDRTHVYRDEEVLDDQMVVSALDVDVKTGIGLGCGHRETEHTFTVTDVEDNRIYELDGRPPLSIYRDLYGDRVDQEQFLMTRPLGLTGGDGDPRVIQLTHVEGDDGSLLAIETPIEEGDRLTILDTSAEAIRSGVETAVDEAMVAAGDPDDIAALLIYDCHTRWYHLSTEEARNAELDVIRERVGEDVPIAGFYSYGEIATPNPLWRDDPQERTANRQGHHQQSIVVEVLSNEPL